MRLMRFPTLILTNLLTCFVFIFLLGGEVSAGCLSLRNQNVNIADVVNSCNKDLYILYNDGSACRSRGNRKFPCGGWVSKNGGRLSVQAVGGIRSMACPEKKGCLYIASEKSYGIVTCAKFKPDCGEYMSGADIRKYIINKSLHYKANGQNYKVTLFKSGKIVTTSNSRIYNKGSWRISGNKLCTKYQSGGHSNEKCNQYKKSTNGSYVSTNGLVFRE